MEKHSDPQLGRDFLTILFDILKFFEDCGVTSFSKKLLQQNFIEWEVLYRLFLEMHFLLTKKLGKEISIETIEDMYGLIYRVNPKWKESNKTAFICAKCYGINPPQSNECVFCKNNLEFFPVGTDVLSKAVIKSGNEVLPFNTKTYTGRKEPEDWNNLPRIKEKQVKKEKVKRGKDKRDRLSARREDILRKYLRWTKRRQIYPCFPFDKDELMQMVIEDLRSIALAIPTHLAKIEHRQHVSSLNRLLLVSWILETQPQAPMEFTEKNPLAGFAPLKFAEDILRTQSIKRRKGDKDGGGDIF